MALRAILGTVKDNNEQVLADPDQAPPANINELVILPPESKWPPRTDAGVLRIDFRPNLDESVFNINDNKLALELDGIAAEVEEDKTTEGFYALLESLLDEEATNNRRLSGQSGDAASITCVVEKVTCIRQEVTSVGSYCLDDTKCESDDKVLAFRSNQFNSEEAAQKACRGACRNYGDNCQYAVLHWDPDFQDVQDVNYATQHDLTITEFFDTYVSIDSATSAMCTTGYTCETSHDEYSCVDASQFANQEEAVAYCTDLCVNANFDCEFAAMNWDENQDKVSCYLYKACGTPQENSEFTLCRADCPAGTVPVPDNTVCPNGITCGLLSCVVPNADGSQPNTGNGPTGICYLHADGDKCTETISQDGEFSVCLQAAPTYCELQQFPFPEPKNLGTCGTRRLQR